MSEKLVFYPQAKKEFQFKMNERLRILTSYPKTAPVAVNGKNNNIITLVALKA